MAERTTIEVESPPGGWLAPWPNIAEIAAALPHSKWTLVGGLMAQLHGIHRGIGTVRPTSDIDMVLHIETTCGVAAEAARTLESLGYNLLLQTGPRSETAHRFLRADAKGDAVGGGDVIDVLIADHPAPRVIEKLRGRRMVAIEGGTQALKRTMNANLQIVPGQVTTISIPSPFGAAILKAAAYQTDPRDKQRHLQDATVLLATIDDPFAERETLAGSDRTRLELLVRALPDDAREWRLLPPEWRTNGQAALRILTA